MRQTAEPTRNDGLTEPPGVSGGAGAVAPGAGALRSLCASGDIPAYRHFPQLMKCRPGPSAQAASTVGPPLNTVSTPSLVHSSPQRRRSARRGLGGHGRGISASVSPRRSPFSAGSKAHGRGRDGGRDGGRPRPRPPRGGPPPGPVALPASPGRARELHRRGPATMQRLPRALLLPLLPVLPVLLALLAAAAAPEAPVSAPRSLVWGPGLQAGVVLPVRYFYLQAVSSEGQNLTRSPPGSVRPRVPLPARPRRPSPAWRPSPGALRRPSSGVVTSSLHLPAATVGEGVAQKSVA